MAAAAASSSSSSSSSSSNDRIRVSISRVGGGNAKVLVYVPSETTLQQLFEKAADKLSAASEGEQHAPRPAFRRVFVENGAEIESIDEIFNNDKLYFSEGDDFAVDSQSGEERVIAKNRFLHMALVQASSLYDQTSGFVKSHSPSLVKVSVERAENAASPLIGKAVEIGEPILNWADDRLDKAYDSIKRRKSFQLITKSPLTNRLNEILRTQIHAGSEFFWNTATESYQKVHAKAGNATAELAHFLADLKQTLGTAWDDKLVEPAKSFFERVATEVEALRARGETSVAQAQSAFHDIFNRVRSQLGAEWEKRVQQVFDTTIAAQQTGKQLISENKYYQKYARDPAEAFYRSAADSYVVLQKTSQDGKVMISDFVGALKAKLGVWSNDLLEPAKQLFAVLSQPKEEENNAPASSSTASSSSQESK